MVEYLEQPHTIFEMLLSWQKLGLQQTASGYGGKLTSSKCVKFQDGRVRRVYITCYSNNGSAWITLGGKKLFLRD